MKLSDLTQEYKWWSNIAENVAIAANIPTSPTFSARIVNFYCKGVSSWSFWIFIFNFPAKEFLPTARIKIVPVPWIIFDPERINGCY
jgi:hypothetical protein